MDVEALSQEAQQLSKQLFVERYPHLFLLFYEEKDNISPVQFWTEVVPRGAAGKSSSQSVLRVLPMIKAPANPYTDRISIGRARNCDVVLRHPSVSKLHAHVRREPDGAWTLHDTGSHNGTSIGSQAVTPAAAVRLGSGDLITFGGVTVRVVDSSELHMVLTRLFHAIKSSPE